MKTSLLITTYNWPEALEITLLSIQNQVLKPSEIIIADDGSGIETLNLIKLWQRKFEIPIIHSWQEDIGFRLATSRNKAIAKSTGDYLIMIDGDLVLHQNFIEDHVKHCKKNQFVIGPRVLLNENYSNELLINKDISFSVPSHGILANKKNLINNNFLSNFFSYQTKSDKQVRGCNMACFKSDIIDVNGFNEDFIGWGREDTELVNRLLNLNVSRKNIKFNCNTLHIFHKENSKTMLSLNDDILEKTKKNKLIRCENGLDKYL
jgi:glycosyltransferase involved in cell wall biosynthesis